ncbi:GNAT family N-acetyltransferase [Streptomyces sp. NPDC051907]|uniref:GNAT family N-acetyltransferase n=1 Tax=Streptomyces sp. NPDC051907 TaxID=3155284 RepID=UPI0034286FC3
MTEQPRLAHTFELTQAELADIRSLLTDAFDGDFGDEDWGHTLGGVHALLYEDGVPVAHGAVIQRRVAHAGRSLRTGYVEGVAVRSDLRRRGLGDRVMEALERVIDGAYDLGALSASDAGAQLYAARGWQLWRGRIEAMTPEGTVHLPDEEDSTYLRPAAGRRLPDPSAALLFDWRDGDVL